MLKFKIVSAITETDNDKKQILKKNKSRLFDIRKAKGDNTPVTDQDAENGPLFNDTELAFFKNLPLELLPTNFARKHYIETLARHILDKKRLPTGEELNSVKDYMTFLATSGEMLDTSEFPFDVLVHSAKGWHDELAAELEKKQAANPNKTASFKTNLVRKEFANGFKIVEMSINAGDKQAVEYDLKQESNFMHHCVGTIHCNTVLDGNETVYSLRDPDNIPKVTMNAYQKGDQSTGIHEIKGIKNNTPKKEYSEMCLIFMAENDLEPDFRQGGDFFKVVALVGVERTRELGFKDLNLSGKQEKTYQNFIGGTVKETSFEVSYKGKKEKLLNGFDGKPAIISYYANGNVEKESYYQNDVHTREEGPATIVYFENGKVKEEAYSQHGVPYRKEGPTRLLYYRNGNTMKEEYYNTRFSLDRKEGPASTIYYEDGIIEQENYYLDGVLHREDGPAIITYDINGKIQSNTAQYWIDGRYVHPAEPQYKRFFPTFNKNLKEHKSLRIRILKKL